MSPIWKRRSFLLLFVILVVSNQSSSANETKQAETSSTTTLMSRKIDVERQGGMLAGPLVLGLSSLLFPVLPILLLAPLAMAGIGPAVNYISESVHGSPTTGSSGSSSSQPLRDVLHSLSQTSNGGLGSTLAALALQNTASGVSGSSPSSSSSASSASSSSPSVTPVAAASSVSSSVAQILGLTGESGGDSSSSAILSGLSSLFSRPDKNSAGSGVEGLFGSSSSFLASGSRPVPSIVSPPGPSGSAGPASPAAASPSSSPLAALLNSGIKNKQPATSSGLSDIFSSPTTSVDNAGLLGTGSVTNQLLNLMSGKRPSGQASSVSSTLQAMHDLLGTNRNPQLGSSLSSNILHSLPQSYNNAVSAASKPATSLASASPASSAASSLSSILSGDSSSSQSGSFQKLANQALTSISSFIFSKRRSEWIPRPYPSFGYFDSASAKVKNGLSSYLKDVMSTFKDGVRRYEIGESECQARLVCELHQKAVGRSFKSWLNTVLDTFGVEDYLESTTFGARTKSAMKDIYKAARNGIGEQDCAITYSKCPVSISVEPIRNSLLNKIVRGSSSGHTLSSQSKTAQVYGPSPSSSLSPSQQVNSQNSQSSQNSMHTPSHTTKSPLSPPTQVPSINHQSSSLPSPIHSHLQSHVQSHNHQHHHPNSLPSATSSLQKQPSLHKQYKSR